MNKRKLFRTFTGSAVLPALVVSGIMSIQLTGCGRTTEQRTDGQGMSATTVGTEPVSPEAVRGSGETEPDDRYRTSYEIFVYSFCDSNGDGIGDLNGIRQKLDYINDGRDGSGDDLECTELWLTPVFPSPTYHKYDAADYEAIDPDFGTMEDYENLIRECHARGIRVLMDLPLNHTSVEHEWFQQASDYLKSLPEDQNPDPAVCPYVDYYNFARDKKDGYELLEGTAWYYEARFWSGMPDLNLDSEAVRSEIADILKFWQEKGVDGFRLDAVTSYYTEDSQATADFLTWLVQTAKENDPDCFLVGEAWEDQSAYAKLYETGIDSLFDFRFAGQDGVIAGTVRGNRKASYYASELEKEEQLYRSYNANAVNAPFYTNHDMARSAGYYTKEGESRVKLAEALNLFQTGNAFLYYGEEIGMKGSGKDENKRAPMYWTAGEAGSADAAGDAGGAAVENLENGMCQGPPDMDEITMKYPPLDEQMQDPDSIFRYVQKAIRIRRSYPVIARGFTSVSDSMTGDAVAAFTRKVEGDEFSPLLIVINTSEDSQTVTLTETDSGTFSKLSDTLDVSPDQETRLDKRELNLAPFGIAILTQQGQ